MKRLTLIAVALVGLFVPTSSAHAAAPTCQGQRATLVGKPDGVVEGTRHRDVVVTNGASYTRTYGGDDLVCVTGGRVYSEVDTRSGNDTVIVLSAKGRVAFFAGTGHDIFRGGAEKDTFTSLDGGDDVRTEANRDDVELDTSRAPSTIDLGPGRDELEVFDDVSDGAGAQVDAGDGKDELRLRMRTKGDVAIDNAAGRLSVDGIVTTVHWSSIETFQLGDVRADHLTFNGSDAAESVRLDGLGSAHHYAIDLGGGNDRLRTLSDTEGQVVGGPGRDTFRNAPEVSSSKESGFTADLAAGTAVATDDTHSWTWTLAEVEDLQARALFGEVFSTIALRGDDEANRLVAKGCAVTVDGRGGADRITAQGSTCGLSGDQRSRATLSGGDGDDRLVGTRGRDIIDGGPGTDTADGGRHRDTCYAESVVRCELP